MILLAPKGRRSKKTMIIFETNFKNDTGYYLTANGDLNYSTGLTGFHAVRAQGNSSLEVGPYGPNGKNAMRFRYDHALGQPTVSLLRHLTENQNTGYSELFIRYRIKLADLFKWGNGTSPIDYWKWMRLAQNEVFPGPFLGENRVDSFYCVTTAGWNPAYNNHMGFSTAWGANEGSNLASGSAGGFHCIARHTSGNRMGPVPNWEIDTTTNIGWLQNQVQDWVNIEFQYKLASSPTAQDGVWRVWYNDVLQNEVDQWVTAYKPTGSEPDFTGIPTAKTGSGFNLFSLMDNTATLPIHWGDVGVQGYFDLADAVIATGRIGMHYEVQ